MWITKEMWRKNRMGCDEIHGAMTKRLTQDGVEP